MFCSFILVVRRGTAYFWSSSTSFASAGKHGKAAAVLQGLQSSPLSLQLNNQPVAIWDAPEWIAWIALV